MTYKNINKLHIMFVTNYKCMLRKLEKKKLIREKRDKNFVFCTTETNSNKLCRPIYYRENNQTDKSRGWFPCLISAKYQAFVKLKQSKQGVSK